MRRPYDTWVGLSYHLRNCLGHLHRRPRLACEGELDPLAMGLELGMTTLTVTVPPLAPPSSPSSPSSSRARMAGLGEIYGTT
jgi:hypothetical protein